MEVWMHQLLQWLALPQFGLSTVFIVALVSATLLPLGSEPAVAGLLQLNPDLFWQAILVATAGTGRCHLHGQPLDSAAPELL